jgi:hypothetical protein
LEGCFYTAKTRSGLNHFLATSHSLNAKERRGRESLSALSSVGI